MRMPFVLALLTTGAWIAMAGMTQAAEVTTPRAHVELDRSGVHVDVGISGPAVGPTMRVRDMIGVGVYNAGNENLGKIEDLVMDPVSGRIRYAVLSFGGFLGLGDKLFAVPWKDLKPVLKGTTPAGTVNEDHYVLDVSKEALKNAPGFDKSHWPDFANRNWSADVDRFYGGHRSASPGGTQRR
jgi:sporulation protein YlmC with PRC-barrel domain